MIAISFASTSHKPQQKRWSDSCQGIKTALFSENSLTVEEKKGYFGERGYGFWFWKPLIIKKALETYPEILYTDVDYTILNPTDALLDETGLTLFTYPFQNRIWTKRDCFYYMNCDEERYWNTQHLEAGISVWKRNDFTLSLLDEWIHYCADKRILSDDANVSGLSNLPEFKDHRHDQSILTNLKEKYGLKTRPIKSLQGIIAGADI